VRRLVEWCEGQGLRAVGTREPGGTVLGEAIRGLVLGSGEVPARSELLLMLAARAAFVDEVVAPALAAGQVVIGDRYELSTLTYQGVGRELGLERVRELNAFATGGLRPDLTIVLAVPPAEGRRRRARGASDRIEREADAFHERIAEAYAKLAATEPAVATVDGMADPDQVHIAITTLLRQRFPETFPKGKG
jgi:dTMP kinase